MELPRFILALAAMVISIIPVATAYCQVDVTEYSSRHVGDTLPVMPNETVLPFHIIIVANPVSCYTCELSVESFIKLHKQYSVPITMFIEGESQQYADEQKDRSKWPFSVLGDPLHLYETLYGVKSPPFYYLTDALGVILLMDKLAGPNVSFELLEKTISSGQRVRNAVEPKLRASKEIAIRDSNGLSVTIGKKHYVRSYVGCSKFVVLDASFKRLYLIDSLGIIQHAYDFARMMTPVGLLWMKPDSVLLIRDASRKFPGNCDVYAFNIVQGQIRRVECDRIGIPKGDHMLYMGVDIVNQNIVGGLSPLSGISLFKDDCPTLARFDLNGKFESWYGTPSGLFVHDSISFLEIPFFSFDAAGRTYEWESPSEVMNIYGSNDKLAVRLRIKFDSTWKAPKLPLPHDTDSPQFWIDYNRNTSWGAGIFPSPEGDWVAFHYYNASYPTNETDPRSSKLLINNFLHFESLGGADSCLTIPFPIGTTPLSVSQNEILAEKYEDNHLFLIWYDVPHFR